MNLSHSSKQVIYTTACFTSFMSMGMLYGFPTVLVSSITDLESDLYTDESTASWVVSIAGFSGLIAVVLLAPLMKLYGRRTAHISISIIISLGWIITSFARSIPILCLGRVLHSLMAGAIYFYSICIGELTNPHLRGIILNLKILAVSSGIGLVHLSGYFLHWRQVSLTVLIPMFISIVIGFFWPESPDWLVSKGRFEEAKDVFKSLRGTGKEAEAEISKLIAAEINKQNVQENSLKKYCTKVFWRPVFLLMCSILVPEFGGRHFIPSYSIQLLAQFTSRGPKSFFFTFAFDIISITGSVTSVLIVNRFSRRRMLLSSGYISVFLLVLSSLIMYVNVNYYDSAFLSWMSLGLLGIYTFLCFTCTFPVSFMIMGEILPLEFREIGSMVDGLMACSGLMLFTKIVPTMKNGLGVYGLFFVCAILMLMALLYVDYEMPETKDRTLQDIGDYFREKSPKIRNKNDVSVYGEQTRHILQYT